MAKKTLKSIGKPSIEHFTSLKGVLKPPKIAIGKLMFNLKKFIIGLVSLIVLVMGFYTFKSYKNMIPNLQMRLDTEQINKLSLINSVELQRASYFDVTCKSYEIGENSYYLVSSDGSRADDFAKWSCGHKLKYINCPNMKVALEGDKALIEVFYAFKDEYSLETVKQCAKEVIANAPTETKATSDTVIKNLNAEKNVSSFKQVE